MHFGLNPIPGSASVRIQLAGGHGRRGFL